MESSIVNAPWFDAALVAGLVVANTPLYWVLYRILFEDLEELWGAIRFWLTPDLISAFRGEYWDDLWAELKLGALIVVSAGAVLLEYTGIHA